MAVPKAALKIHMHELPELGNHFRETSGMELHNSAEEVEGKRLLLFRPFLQKHDKELNRHRGPEKKEPGKHDRQEVEALSKKEPFVLNNNPFYPLKVHLKRQHEVILSLLFKYVLVRILFCWAS